MKFFVLQNPELQEGVSRAAVTDFLPEGNAPKGEAPRCPVCGGFVGGLPLLPPVRVALETWGAEFGDIAHGVGYELLVSERFLRGYRVSGLTGLEEVGPVEVLKLKRHRKLLEPMPRYHCCRVQVGRAAIDDGQSGIVRDRPATCPECRTANVKRGRRIILEPGTWAGEDVFRPRGLYGRIMASVRFKSFCDENRITNCLLIPAEEFHFDHYPWEREGLNSTRQP
jgi:hypothetical protein